MTKAIRHLDFDAEQPIGFEIIPMDDHDARNKKNLSAPHRASFYCVLWIRQGRVTHYVDFTPVQISASSFLFIGRDSVQFFDQLNPFKAEVLLFTTTFFCQHPCDHAFLKNSFLFNPFIHDTAPISVAASKQMEELWAQMSEESKNIQTVFKAELLKNYLHNLLLLAKRDSKQGLLQTGKASPQSAYVHAFIDDLELHFTEQQPIRFYADKLAITTKVLNNAVQKIRGKTPKEVITERLLLEAKRLLVYSPDSIKEIGFALGFEEPTNFVKFFKMNAAMTPLAFRNAHHFE